MTFPYVVLQHTGFGDAHYDLMLDPDGVSKLHTWQFSNWPPSPKELAPRIADHRREYLEYEGLVSGGRGQVARIASGLYSRTSPENILLLDSRINLKLRGA